jgi:hypothetical protein
VLPAGADVRNAVTEMVSPWFADRKLEVIVRAVAVSPVSIDPVVAEITKESACEAAFDGTTDITPKPKAATDTSAMRLIVVFVDICFLSIVDPRTIRGSA